MKNKLILLLSVFVVILSATTDSYAQKTKSEKLTKAQKRDAQNKKRNAAILSMIEEKKFSFIIQSVDKETSPSLAHMELRGGYMIKVTPKEFTAHLPFMGPNQKSGNSPGYNELSFGAPNYKMELETNPEVGLRIIIKATDIRSGYLYTFMIDAKESMEKMTVLVSGLQEMVFLGSMRAVK